MERLSHGASSATLPLFRPMGPGSFRLDLRKILNSSTSAIAEGTVRFGRLLPGSPSGNREIELTQAMSGIAVGDRNPQPDSAAWDASLGNAPDARFRFVLGPPDPSCSEK